MAFSVYINNYYSCGYTVPVLQFCQIHDGGQWCDLENHFILKSVAKDGQDHGYVKGAPIA